MAMRWIVCIFALAALMVTGCSVTGRCTSDGDCGPGSRPPDPEPVLSLGCMQTCGPLELDRGDWAVSRLGGVWKALESQPDRPPRHVGFVTRRRFKQMRGGPSYDMYEVTTLNRAEHIGHIDQMGRAWRYEPQRNTGFEKVDLGISNMENGVAAIFDTSREMFLERTTERRIAFDLLDRDGSGYLEEAELAKHGDRIRAGDKDRDGRVDFEEFDAVPVL